MPTSHKRSYKIETLKKHYHKQWLLIGVDKVDKSTTTPISGHLIAHSPNRSETYQLVMKIPRKYPLLIEYSEDRLPKGFAVAFFFYEQV